MIYLAITDVCNLKAENISSDELSSISYAIAEKNDRTKIEKEKKLRYAAYSTLVYLYKKLYPEVIGMPCVDFTEEGKPYFTKNSDIPCPVFSISHDGDFAAVAISDENTDIGVDIQSMPKNKTRLERIAQRFLSVFRRSDATYIKIREDSKRNKTDVPEDFYSLFFSTDEFGSIKECEGSELLSISILDEELVEYEYLTKWTALEAALKMSGGGFSDYKDAEKIIESANIISKVFRADKKVDYAVSVAYL